MNSFLSPKSNNAHDSASSSQDNLLLIEDQLTLASENGQLPQEVFQNLHQTDSQEEIFTITVEEARKRLKCERAIIYALAEPGQGRVVAEAVAPGWTKALGMIIEDSYFEEAPVREKYKAAPVEVLDNIRVANLTRGYFEHLQTLQVKAQLAAPLLNEDKLFGLLVAQKCSDTYRWHSEEIEFLNQLAVHTGFLLDFSASTNSINLKQQAETRTRWEQSYLNLSQQLYQSHDQEEIFQTTVEAVHQVLNCERVVVYSLNQERYGVVIAEALTPGWTRALGMTIEDPCFEARYLEKYRHGRVKALANITQAGLSDCYLDQLAKLEVKANLVTPILRGEEIVGLLVAHQCSAPRHWQPEEISWVRQIAAQVGFALEHAQVIDERDRLQQQAQTEAQWTQFFTDAIQYIRQSLQEEDILKATVREARRVLNCDRVVVYSLNQDRYGVVVAESVAPGWTRALGKTIQDPCFAAKYLDKYRNGRVRAWENIKESGMTQCYIEQLATLEVKANLVTPILNQGKLFGLLVAHECAHPRAWQQYEIRWLAQIATQVGLALDNAKLLKSATGWQQRAATETQWRQWLKELTQNLRQHSQPEALLGATVEEARRILGCERVVVYSLKGDDYGEVRAESVAPGWTRALGMTLQDPCFEAKYLEKYRHGRVKALDNIAQAGLSECYLEQLAKLEVKANLVTPILHAEEIFGLLVAHHCAAPHQWQPEEIEFLSQLALQVGLGVERAFLVAEQKQLHQQAATEAQWTQYFTQAVQYIRQSLKQSDILEIAVEEVRRVLSCERVVVYSLNQDRYGVVVAESVAPGWTRALGKRIQDPCFEARYLEKYRDGRVKALDNIAQAGLSGCYLEQLAKLEVKANLVTPILNQGKLFGLLVAHQCSAPRPWQQYEIRWLTQIATQVGFALDNANLLNTAPVLISLHNLTTGKLAYINNYVEELLGFSPEEMYAMSAEEITGLIHPDDLESVSGYVKRCQFARRGSKQTIEYRVRHKQGDYRPIQAKNAVFKRDKNKVATTLISIAEDIDERKRFEKALFEEKELAQVTLHSIGDAVITTDVQGQVKYLNPVAEHLTGWTTGKAKGLPLSEVFQIVNELTGEPVENPVETVRRKGLKESLANHTVLVARDGLEYAIDGLAASICSSDGQMIGVVLIFHDVTQSRNLARQLSWQATHDALTGLLNRPEFERCVEEAISAARIAPLTPTARNEQHHTLCYIDLDQFKVVNDTCGHAAGDELLRQLTALLQQRVRANDTLARLGGDEFGLLMDQCPLPQAEKIADTLRQLIGDFRFSWQGRTFTLGASIGVVPIDESSLNLTSVLSAADAACYAAKEKGRDRVHVYRDNDLELARQRGERQWIARINQALAENRFQLYSQKIVSITRTEAEHAEILLRLVDEKDQIVLPMAFIPAAERYDLMPALDRWVIRTFFSRYAEYCQRQLLTGKRQFQSLYTINLSGASVNSEQFLEFVKEQFFQFPIPPQTVCFEITETTAIANLKQATHLIRSLKQLGCSFALDDFGSGMSSLVYLKNLPVDYLKIDGSFVRNLLSDPIDCTMVEYINRIAQVMEIETIAEFVENEAILEKLGILGVDYAQGYGIASPSPLSFSD